MPVYILQSCFRKREEFGSKIGEKRITDVFFFTYSYEPGKVAPGTVL